MKKLLFAFLTILSLLICSGCAIIKSDVTIKEDLIGTWTGRLYSGEKANQSDIEPELKKQGLQNYTMKPFVALINVKTYEVSKIVYKEGEKEPTIEQSTNPDIKPINGWEITAPFKDQDDLNKIISCIQIVEDRTNNKNAPATIFQKDQSGGKTTVNLSTLKLSQGEDMTFHVEGIIDPSTTKGKLIDESTIVFTFPQTVIFTFEPGLPITAAIAKSLPIPTIPGVNNTTIGVVVISLVGIGVILYQKKKDIFK